MSFVSIMYLALSRFPVNKYASANSHAFRFKESLSVYLQELDETDVQGFPIKHLNHRW